VPLASGARGARVVGRLARLVLPLLLATCGGSGGGPGGGETLTSYPGCLPPCLDTVLEACLGNASSCTDNVFVTCWDTGARRIDSSSGADGGGTVQDDLLYAPDGSLCLTVRTVTIGQTGYTPVGTYTDATGNVFATADYDPKLGFVYHCDGKTYAAQPVLLSTNCSDNANLLTGNGCSQSFSCQ
jgi:hypothetical protein